MPVTQDKPGPYAPSTVTLNIVERYRERGIPAPINVESLLRTGLVTDSLAPRTISALISLDLIDEAGNPTDTLKGLQRASTGDYQACLAEWVRKAYADVLSFIDPATATEQDVHDSFRLYTPQGQRDRMVTLFLGLARAAGIAPEKATGAGTGAPRKKAAGTTQKKPRVEKVVPPATEAGVKQQGHADLSGQQDRRDRQPPADDFRATLLGKFPDFDPSWSEELKKAWFADFDLFMKMVTPP